MLVAAEVLLFAKGGFAEPCYAAVDLIADSRVQVFTVDGEEELYDVLSQSVESIALACRSALDRDVWFVVARNRRKAVPANHLL